MARLLRFLRRWWKGSVAETQLSRVFVSEIGTVYTVCCKILEIAGVGFHGDVGSCVCKPPDPSRKIPSGNGRVQMLLS